MFTVTTYNVLADVYHRPEYYPLVDPALLPKDVRYPRIVERVAGFGTDIICLQEVDFELFEMIQNTMRCLGYDSRWAQKAGGKHDGCAIITAKRWQTLCTDIMHYRDHRDAKKRSGFIAQSALIRKDESIIGIVNTHLKWNRPDTPRKNNRGLKQAKELCEKFSGALVPHIVCGDMNAEPRSPVMNQFEDSGYARTHEEHAPTFNSFHGGDEGIGLQIDHILHTEGLVAEPHPTPMLTPDIGLPNDTEPSDHLPLSATLRFKE